MYGVAFSQFMDPCWNVICHMLGAHVRSTAATGSDIMHSTEETPNAIPARYNKMHMIAICYHWTKNRWYEPLRHFTSNHVAKIKQRKFMNFVASSVLQTPIYSMFELKIFSTSKGISRRTSCVSEMLRCRSLIFDSLIQFDWMNNNQRQ